MLRNKLVLPVLAILLASGCDNTPSSADIDMGPDGQEAAPESMAVTENGGIAPDLELIPVGEGKVDRIVEKCNIEQVNGTPFSGSPVPVPTGAPVIIDGWVLDGTPTSSVELRLVSESDASTYRIETVTDVPRDDVASAFGADPAVVKPGFSVSFNVEGLPAGEYRLQIVVPSTENGAAVCDNGRVVSITD